MYSQQFFLLSFPQPGRLYTQVMSSLVSVTAFQTTQSILIKTLLSIISEIYKQKKKNMVDVL